MSDLIRRQDVLDEIRRFSGYLDEDMMTRVYIGLNRLPSTQQEIIHCKDCEHWDMTWQNDFAPNYHYCPLIDGTRRSDFYCADAERRGERDG